MAQKTIVQLVDDLDGTQADDISTVTFSLDGVTYEIDLTETNASNLRKSLDEFVAHARRTGGRLKRGTATKASSGSATASHEQAQAIREWARRNGHEVSNRGRIPGSLIEAFEAAQSEASAKTRGRRRTRAAAS
jgi:nucleoid-associated protein Lsr2